MGLEREQILHGKELFELT